VDDNTFAGYTSWHLQTTKQDVDPANGGLHDGNDSMVVRKVDDDGPLDLVIARLVVFCFKCLTGPLHL